MGVRRAVASGVAIAAAFALTIGGWAQDQKGVHPKAPVRITMEELHKHGGVPPGWQFTLPEGEPKAGREVFVKLECYKCHEVKKERFPNAPKRGTETGPELTGMGGLHPAEYLAESILNPNAVIVTGPGYAGPDGLSIMPDYRESLTVGELIDLVAYLKSLKGEHGHMSPDMPMDKGSGQMEQPKER